MANATKQAIWAIVIYAAIQLTLLFYSVCHPSVDGLVTASLLLAMIFYPAVWRYHAHKIKTSSRRSSELSQNSN